MNSESFRIARRILKNKEQPVVKLSKWSVVVGLMVVLITICIVRGFQNEIRDKVVGFSAHIQISHRDLNNSFEASPISKQQDFLSVLKAEKRIRHIQCFVTKNGIMQANDQIEGVVLKGVDANYDFTFLQQHLCEGNLPDFSADEASKEILVSQNTADKLNLKVGDKVKLYFIQDPPRERRLTIVGIYDTGLEEYDSRFAFVDMRQLQKLNGWTAEQVGGFELYVTDFADIDNVGDKVKEEIHYDMYATTIKEQCADIFNWLSFFDYTGGILIALVIFICGVTITSALLVMVFERTKLIGICKAIGFTNNQVAQIFLYIAAILIGKAVVIGNAVGVLLCWVQYRFHLITLDSHAYYMDFVPIQFDVVAIIVVNICSVLICLAALLLPARLLMKKISPVEALRFE